MLLFTVEYHHYEQISLRVCNPAYYEPVPSPEIGRVMAGSGSGIKIPGCAWLGFVSLSLVRVAAAGLLVVIQ